MQPNYPQKNPIIIQRKINCPLLERKRYALFKHNMKNIKNY